MLRSLVLEAGQGSWAHWLGHVEFAINSTVSASTGQCPFELTYGANVVVPADVMVQSSRVTMPEARDTARLVAERVAKARGALMDAQAAQKKYYDAHHRLVEFDVGQKVWLSARNLTLPGSRKLSQRWLGPFEIVARVGAVAYRLSLPEWLRGIHPTFHVGLLKKHSVGGDGRSPEGPRPILVDGQQEWEVSHIARQRGTGRHHQYLVVYKGYDLS